MYKEHYPSAKARKDELCVIGTLDGQISAVVRFKNIDVYRLLTGMLVLPENQKKGLGRSCSIIAARIFSIIRIIASHTLILSPFMLVMVFTP
ncbi:putative uncharacterized protein [Vibrio anguillarum]|nr:putative uncharacterized protein [Vibrio anguillarum]